MKKSTLIQSSLFALLGLCGIASADAPTSLRGKTYADLTFGSGAADNAVEDLTERPYLANGQKLFYFEPGVVSGDRKAGVITIADGSETWFAHGAENSSISNLNIGRTIGGNLGVSLFFGSNKTNTSTKRTSLSVDTNGTATTQSTNTEDISSTLNGDLIGFGIGINLPNSEIYGNLKYTSIANEFSFEDKTTIGSTTTKTTTDTVKSAIKLLIGWRNIAQTPTSYVLDLRLNLDYIQDSSWTKSNNVITSSTPENNYIIVKPTANWSRGLGTQVIGLRPFIGGIIEVPSIITGSSVDMTIAMTPYFTVEYKVFENWAVLGGYKYRWDVNSLTKTEEPGKPAKGTAGTYTKTETSEWSSVTPSSIGQMGLVYNKGSFTVETTLGAETFGGTGYLFTGNDIFAKTSVMWNY